MTMSLAFRATKRILLIVSPAELSQGAFLARLTTSVLEIRLCSGNPGKLCRAPI